MFLRGKMHLSFYRLLRICGGYLYVVMLLTGALFFSSCEKVISLNLNSAEKRYVIEANIADTPGTCQVVLTQTKNFEEDNAFAGIGGAQVTLSDNGGAPFTLRETSPGVYEDSAFTGVPGHRYHLSVTVEGRLFTATSVMPQAVPFDSLAITERSLFGQTNQYANVFVPDPPGAGNAYRFVQYVNGIKEESIFVFDDDYVDGRTIERTLFFFYDDEEEDQKKFKPGDVVRIDMMCIDHAVYKYWFSLDQSATGNSQSASPGNPVSNIDGGALGYFSAHTLTSKTAIVP